MDMDLLNKHQHIIVYDGVCKLCNGWSQFVVKRDKYHRFKLASVQSEVGQSILQHFAMPIDTFDTMLYIEKGIAYQQSDAFLNIITDFPRPWCWLAVLRFIPKTIRDWCYDRIALNRYRLFGKYDYCMIPSEAHKDWFLDAE